MFKKAEYELSEVGASIETNEKKVYDRKISIRNLCKVEFYFLFVFTLFLSIIGINIFIGCANLKSNYEVGVNKVENDVKLVEDFINFLPTNFSFWINQQTTAIDGITNEIVTYGILTPTNFINTTINQFVDNLNIILGGTVSGVNLILSINKVDIPEIFFTPWNLDIPVEKVIQVMDIIVNIPYYFGVFNLVISILFIMICVTRAIILFFDFRSRLDFICKISFWIGFIFGLVFLFIMCSLIYVHFLYVENVGRKIQEVQGYIEGNITIYNDFMDTNEVIVGEFISENLNVLVNVTNKMIEELRIVLEENVNRILSLNARFIFDKLDLVEIFVSLDDFKIDPKIIDLEWINEKIQSILVALIIVSGVLSAFFGILVLIVCCERKK